jgi:hypothetical protein
MLGEVRLGMVRPINAHGNLLMVITVQMAVTGGAGAKPLLGSTNSVWCYGLVRLGMVRYG